MKYWFLPVFTEHHFPCLGLTSIFQLYGYCQQLQCVAEPHSQRSRQNSLWSFIHPQDHTEYPFNIFKPDQAGFTSAILEGKTRIQNNPGKVQMWSKTTLFNRNKCKLDSLAVKGKEQLLNFHWKESMCYFGSKPEKESATTCTCK